MATRFYPFKNNRVPFFFAISGLMIALLGAIQETRWTDSAVARVNGIAITQESYDFAVKRLKNGAQNAESTALRFLIDEELLIQRALQTGLVQSDATTKKAVVRSVLNLLNEEVRTMQPENPAFKKFWEQRRALFTAQFGKTGQAEDRAWKEFTIRYPDILLRRLLDQLRAGSDVKINPRVFKKYAWTHSRKEDTDSSLPAETAAVVNGVEIQSELLARAFDALVANRRSEAQPKDLEFSLDRVIEEELLFQHGMAVGVIQSNRYVRTVITRTMMETITTRSLADGGEDASVKAISSFFKSLRAGAQIELPAWAKEVL